MGDKGRLQGQFQASSKGSWGFLPPGVASRARPTAVSTSATFCSLPVTGDAKYQSVKAYAAIRSAGNFLSD